MKVAVHGYHAGKAWLCICVGVEPPFSKSWIRHCGGRPHNLVVASVKWPVMIKFGYALLPISLLMELATRGCVGELEDTRRDTHWDFLQVHIKYFLTIMLMVYQSLITKTLNNIFGLLLVAVLKDDKMLVTVLVLVMQEILLLLLLQIITIVKQFH